MITGAVVGFLDRFTQWAIAQQQIQAAALVGSYARGTATADSDVDLVILAHHPEQLLLERTWVRMFGDPVVDTLEDYGLLKSVRVRYDNGLEVEFGVADVQWPLDAGSQQVMRDGMRILFDRGRILRHHL